MSLRSEEEIGLETHDDRDQFIPVETGKAMLPKNFILSFSRILWIGPGGSEKLN
jgi:hypothetical protein